MRGTKLVLLITAGLIGSLLYVGSASGVARFGDVEPIEVLFEIAGIDLRAVTGVVTPRLFDTSSPSISSSIADRVRLHREYSISSSGCG